MSDHNAVCLHIDNEKGDRKIKVHETCVKDHVKLKRNAVKALYPFLRTDFNPQLAEKVLEESRKKESI